MDYDLQSVQQARDLARQGSIAAEKIASYTDELIDSILCCMVQAVRANAVRLARMAVEETGFGNVPDKTYKNHLASQVLYDFIKPMKTIGVINEDPVNKVIEIAEPVGLLMGITPSTNPTSTTIYKAMVAIKSRNAIVFAPHPAASKCTQEAVKILREAAVKAGAP
ncbi:MAG: aldehyde dehydrogenase family protein, partial [Desulfovibrionales bacterium]|nr:aldehyde dehydrogenase family protein [Desulfovibrionales bacterium]